MGCDIRVFTSFSSSFSISIRAPEWGATSIRSTTGRKQSYFNPRTRMGCDAGRFPIYWSLRQFQSTHPHGVRRNCPPEAGKRVVISIHAPAWGATLPRGHRCRDIPFQSTHPHGVRQYRQDKRYGGNNFNPRTRMGCDRMIDYIRMSKKDFNPRTRMGCDSTLTID